MLHTVPINEATFSPTVVDMEIKSEVKWPQGAGREALSTYGTHMPHSVCTERRSRSLDLISMSTTVDSCMDLNATA